MSNVQQIIKRNAYALTVVLLLLAVTAPSMIMPRLVSADAQAVNRQIKMSSSATSASAQTYEIKFTTATTSVVQGVVIDFCDGDSGSPIIGSSACDLPDGMTVGTTVDSVAGLTAGTWSATTTQSNRTLVLTNGSGASVNDSVDVTISVSGFTNPSNARTFYARILTFATSGGATGYLSGTPGSYVDGGGVALATTQAVGVTATVQETLTFCVGAGSFGNGCTGNPGAPNIVLGDTNNTPVVLDPAAVYQDDVNFQLSTNAAAGAIVRIKGSSANLTSGLSTIPAIGSGTSATPVQMQDGATSGSGAFGLRLATVGDITAASRYAGAAGFYNMYAADVTSTYGDQIASSAGPVLNVNVPVTFGATAGPTTPAGVYTASFSLIATPTY